MMIFHKIYVAMIAFTNMIKCLYRVSDRIAAIRIEVVTDSEIESLEAIQEDRVKNLAIGKQQDEDDDDDINPPDGFIH